jgi:putative protease
MSLSGQCYLSSMIGRRSGNRGLCAQPCRLPFAGSQREYSLSLKDMSLVEQLPDLATLGVSSFKIEGRMKRPEYVAAAVTACRNALEGRPVDFDKLMAVFSRSGFTQNYYLGKPGVDMFGIRQKEDVTAATNKLLSGFEGLYRNEMPLVPVDMTLELAADTPAKLTLADSRGNRVEKTGEAPQIALNRPTDEALARRSLEKTGGTPYYLRNLTCKIGEGLMMPVSALNGLRSAALEELTALREEQGNRYTFLPEKQYAPTQKAGAAPVEPALRIRLQKAEQFDPEMVKAAQLITLPWRELEKLPRWERWPEKFAAEVPNMLFDGQWEQMLAAMAALKERGLRHALVANIGLLEPLKALGLKLHGTFNLNLTNSTAVAEYGRLGLADSELSIELAMHQAKKVVREMPLGLVAYGYLPLMYTRSCPIRGPKGCGSCPGKGVLTDRMGNRFTVDCVDRRHSRLLNMVPLSLSDRMADLRGLDFATLYFTHESGAECMQVVQAFRSGVGTSGKRTGGLYYRDEL